ncbi:hypothetical protein KGP36_07060 [Patescibacteria group bacterium]|nr:hypothetical protein [Patescibacteria group bacterium]MDE1941256.1 hypothetical protein [Patescibacteria group bacterium]
MNSMLAVQDQPRFISRIFTDACGRQFRLTFLVAIVNGELKGRLVSAERISDVARLTGDISDIIFCLPNIRTQDEGSTEYISPYVPIVSPYTELIFLTSQPTRAPSFA